MPIDYAADAAFLLSDVGVEVAFGDATFHALVDNAERFDEVTGQVIGHELRMLYATSEVTLADNDEIVYNGETYYVKDKMDDAKGKAYCKLASER